MVITVNGKEAIRGEIPTLVTAGFSANECFDVGIDLGSPVSEAYFDKAPFPFTGEVKSFEVEYVQ